MSEQQHHQMTLESTQSSGIEEWVCPECGRRVQITWPPNYKKVVLVAGDEDAVHSGSKGGVSMQAPRLISKEALEPQKDHRLSVWSDWMDKIHFDDWWDEDD
jgi:hypothetical protein